MIAPRLFGESVYMVPNDHDARHAHRRTAIRVGHAVLEAGYHPHSIQRIHYSI